MIQKSDFFILVLATAGLSVGVFRWYQNTQNVSAVTISASSTVVIPAPEMPPESTTASTTASTTVMSSVAKQIDSASVVLPTASNANLAAVDTPITAPASVELKKYTVQSGDYLSKIAVTYDTDVSTLQRLNDIDGTTIHAGQTLVYPITSNN